MGKNYITFYKHVNTWTSPIKWK